MNFFGIKLNPMVVRAVWAAIRATVATLRKGRKKSPPGP